MKIWRLQTICLYILICSENFRCFFKNNVCFQDDESEDDSDEEEAMEDNEDGEEMEEGEVDQNFRLELMKVLQQQNALVCDPLSGSWFHSTINKEFELWPLKHLACFSNDIPACLGY